jgi:hypothetical protein
MEKFGIIVTCSTYDLHFAKGTCASIRYFLGEVPVCLLTDGRLNTKPIEAAYNNIIVINREEIKNEFLRQNCRGYGFTKYAAFWESPFETFLHIDADAVVWGNALSYLGNGDFDIMIDKPTFEYSHRFINETFFNTDILNKYFPDYVAAGKPYVCSGVFFAKKNCFSLEEYKSLMQLHRQEPDLWKCGEQGMFNFMIFKGKESGLRVSSEYFQYVVLEYDKEQTARRFNNVNLMNNTIGKPLVIHWAGITKPHVKNSQGYNTEIMTTFRKKFLEDYGVPGMLHSMILQQEDWNYQYKVQSGYFKRRIRERIKL